MDRLDLLVQRNGYFTRPQALAEGLDDRAIRRALAAGQWTRIRQGVYTQAAVWAAADREARHRIEAHAVAHRLAGRVALSHTSAAAMHALALWGVELDQIHATRLDGSAGRAEARVRYHEGGCGRAEVVDVDGVACVRPLRAALEVAMISPLESGLVTLDAALHSGCSLDEMAAATATMHRWPGARRLHLALRLADGRAESVGESRTRYLCYFHNLPAPELQFEVYDEHGTLAGIADFAWPEHKLLGEFDGRVKYGRHLRSGEGPGDAVFREKRREDRLRELTQWSMVRVTWGDLQQGAATAERIRRLLRRAA